jgi:hypothetical protein
MTNKVPVAPQSMSDEGTYWKRVLRIFGMVDPRKALLTQRDVDEALELLSKPRNGTF